MDSNFLGINAMPNTTKISSKADALTYAIGVTKTADGLHLDMADRVFRMFLDNIELPNITDESQTIFYTQATKTMEALYEQAKELVLKYVEKEKAEVVVEKVTETTQE